MVPPPGAKQLSFTLKRTRGNFFIAKAEVMPLALRATILFEHRTARRARDQCSTKTSLDRTYVESSHILTVEAHAHKRARWIMFTMFFM